MWSCELTVLFIALNSLCQISKFSSVIGQIVLLLRLVPLLPFNMLNYLLSVTPVSIGEYMLASWLGMMVFASLLNYHLSVILSKNFSLLYMCFSFWWFCYTWDLTFRMVFVTANNPCFSLCWNNS